MNRLTLTAIISVFLISVFAGGASSVFASSKADSAREKADSLFTESTAAPGEGGLPVKSVAGEKTDQDMQLSDSKIETKKTEDSILAQEQVEKKAADDKINAVK